MKIRVCALSSLCILASSACAQRTPEQILAHHVATFTHRNWNGVLADYAEDAVFLGPDAPIEGKRKLLGFFHSLDNHVPPLRFEERLLAVQGDVGQIEWVMNRGQPGAMAGRDVFIIRHGEIVFQGTVAVHSAAASAP